MRIPYQKLENEVYRATKKAYQAICDAHSAEGLYVFALFTNDSVQQISAVANTEEGLKRTLERYLANGYQAADLGDMRWDYGDWEIMDEGLEFFDTANEILSRVMDYTLQIDDDKGETIIEKLFDAILKALRKVHLDGTFGKGKKRQEITFMLVGDLPDEFLYQVIKLLNPPSVSKNFKDWEEV